MLSSVPRIIWLQVEGSLAYPRPPSLLHWITKPYLSWENQRHLHFQSSLQIFPDPYKWENTRQKNLIPPVAIKQALHRILFRSSQFHGSWSCSHATYKFMCNAIINATLFSSSSFAREQEVQFIFPPNEISRSKRRTRFKSPNESPSYDALFCFVLLWFSLQPSITTLHVLYRRNDVEYFDDVIVVCCCSLFYYVASKFRRNPGLVGGYLNEIVITSPAEFS